jgi:hypothetical protein
LPEAISTENAENELEADQTAPHFRLETQGFSSRDHDGWRRSVTSEASKQGQVGTSAGTSAWVALLPLAFIAAGIGAIGFAASLSVRARPAPVVAAPAVAEPISPREQARLAEQITAFALTKVGPERFEAEVRDVSKRPSIALSEAVRANARLVARKADKTEKPAVKVASVLPPPRPAIIVASVAPPRPSLVPVGFVPAANVPESKPGVLAQMANYVPSPRRIVADAVSDAWSLGGKVGKLIPRI